MLLFALISLISALFFILKNDNTPASLPKNSSQLKDCLQAANSELCFAETAEKAIREKGIKYTLDQISDIAKTTSSFTDTCHGIMHIIGETAYQSYKLDKNFEPTPSMNNCSYGFYHGFMETMFGASGSYQEGADFCRLMDRKSQEINITGECFHGLGHGITEDHTIEKIDNVSDFIQKDLKICKLVSDNPDEQHQCSTGVFNGLANMYLAMDKGLTINKNDPLWMCPAIENLFAGACYGLMSRVVLAAADSDVGAAIRLAKNTISQQYIATVIQNIMVVTVFDSSTDSYVQNLRAQCSESASEYEKECITGLVTARFQSARPGSEYSRAFEFCTNSTTSLDLKNNCFMTVYVNLPKLYTRQQIVEICSTLGERKDECVAAAISPNR